MRSRLTLFLVGASTLVLLVSFLWMFSVLNFVSPVDEALKRIEKGREPKDRLAALLELQKIVKEQNLSPKEQERIIPKLLQLANSDADKRVRSASLSLLLLLGVEGKEFQQVLVNSLHRSTQEAYLAVKVLPQIADKSTWLSLMDKFESESDPTVTDRLIRILRKVPTEVWKEICARLGKNPQRWQLVAEKLPSPPMSFRSNLVQLALGSDLNARKGTLMLLAKFPPFPEDAQKLEPLASSQDGTVRALVFSIWAQSPSNSLIPKLQKSLSDQPEVAYFASAALLKLGALRPEEGRKLLRQPYAPLRAQGALALLPSQLPSDFQALEEALKDPNPEVVRNAAIALVAKGTKGIETVLRVYEQEKSPERRAAMLTGVSNAEHPKVVATMVRALRFGDWREKSAALAGIALQKDKALPALKQLAQSDDKNDRLAVVDALNAVKTPNALKLLLQIARSDPDEQVRCEALVVLSNYGVKEAFSLLADLVEKGEPSYATVAAMGLTRYGEDGRKLLREMLKSERKETRHAAARALATLNDRAALDILREQANTADISQRIATLQLMARAGDEKALRELVGFLAHEEPLIRLRVRLSLFAVGKLAIPSLLQALDSPDSKLRAEAALVLGALKASVAREKLASLLKDENQRVREAASQALSRLEEP